MSEINWLFVVYEYVFVTLGVQLALEHYFGGFRLAVRQRKPGWARSRPALT